MLKSYDYFGHAFYLNFLLFFRRTCGPDFSSEPVMKSVPAIINTKKQNRFFPVANHLFAPCLICLVYGRVGIFIRFLKQKPIRTPILRWSGRLFCITNTVTYVRQHCLRCSRWAMQFFSGKIQDLSLHLFVSLVLLNYKICYVPQFWDNVFTISPPCFVVNLPSGNVAYNYSQGPPDPLSADTNHTLTFQYLRAITACSSAVRRRGPLFLRQW